MSFLIKTPLPFLLLAIVGILALAMQFIHVKSKDHLKFAIPILLPVIFLLAMAMSAGHNLALRHIFIIYPFLFIAAGVFLAALYKRISIKWFTLLLVVIVVYYGLNLVRIFPDYVAYVNEIGGGTKYGYKNLTQDDIDWGQGLIELKHYAGINHIKQLPVVYYGWADPDYYGFKTLEQNTGVSRALKSIDFSKVHGYLAVSVTSANFMGLHQRA